MGTLPWYVTREDLRFAIASQDSARNNKQLDRALESASRAVEDLCRRAFYPTVATRYKDWPTKESPTSWRLWLDKDELISVTSLTAGGTTISSSDYFLEPINDGPPYNRIEIDLDSSVAFESGNTHQRNVSITGVFGYDNNTVTAGTLGAAIATTSATTCEVSDSSLVGIGSLLTIDSEKVIVTGKSWLDSTQNIGGSLTASAANVSVAVTTGSAYHEDEIILVDSERMRIESISGNTLTVKRAWDGSVLAAHTTGADIYAPRTLTIVRGVLGTTAATHLISVAVTAQSYPGQVRALCLAEALNTLEQETSAYARTIGSGENERNASGAGIEKLRKSVKIKYGRRLRGTV